MSIESARAFVGKMKTDEDFAKKVLACKDADARMAMVRGAGFDFTQDEINSVKNELTEDELDAVAGGSWHCISDIIAPVCNLVAI